ncbi:MAG: hypothetical protein K9G36_02775 [Crocinitomicaceae bacterium]|jgi:MFS transporter, putative metabolite:H+ symporter|nr:hypothetical protein [Crocinitomicaceae bacterium]MCF8410780.1 hypothetical protein [Crocinitomicaceae bacterium]MCF8445194.1 hypothetical protein [Crocinitomicaceae bacterium]
MKTNSTKQITLIIVVAALGYFVDIYDLVLFGVVKSESLDQIMVGADVKDLLIMNYKDNFGLNSFC